ncbi:MAG: PilW family protein [Thiohalophilus sp.]
MKQSQTQTRSCRGFTIIELMISIVIASILMLGVMQVFYANKHASTVGTGLARIQENIRFTLKDIGYATRMAGYKGCSDNLTNHLDPDGDGYDEELFDFDSATGGWEFSDGAGTSVTSPDASYTLSTVTPASDGTKWENTGGDGLPDSLLDRVIPGSDVLVLKWADSNTGVDVKNMTTNSASITTVGKNDIGKGTILMVSDCSGGDAFQSFPAQSGKALTRASGGSGKSPGNKNPGKHNWSHAYTEGAEILTFLSRAYFVGQGISGEPALYRITYVQGSNSGDYLVEELAEGVENMQVLYGYDVDGDDYADRFVTAQDLPDHAGVVALKLAFLARSAEEIRETATSKNYTLLGTDITTPSDKRLRYAFSTTIKLRNKGIK